MLGRRECRLLEQLWCEQAGPMRSFMLRCAGETGEADEVVSEVFWRACRALAQGHYPRHNPRGWLWQILHNYRIDRARRRRREPLWIGLDEGVNYGQDYGADYELGPETGGPARESVDPAAASCFNTLEVQMQVRAGLESLPPRQAELMILRHYRGYALDEIAQAWAISYGAAKAIHHRALVGMRTALGSGD